MRGFVGLVGTGCSWVPGRTQHCALRRVVPDGSGWSEGCADSWPRSRAGRACRECGAPLDRGRGPAIRGRVLLAEVQGEGLAAAEGSVRSQKCLAERPSSERTSANGDLRKRTTLGGSRRTRTDGHLCESAGRAGSRGRGQARATGGMRVGNPGGASGGCAAGGGPGGAVRRDSYACAPHAPYFTTPGGVQMVFSRDSANARPATAVSRTAVPAMVAAVRYSPRSTVGRRCLSWIAGGW